VGLDRERVALEPFSPEWRRRYEREVERLRSLVGDEIMRFEHVGSTAVEGLCAKPIVDVLGMVEDLSDARGLVETLEANGYEYRPDDEFEERLFFAKGPAADRTHYLHVAERGSSYATEMIAFRDALRSDASLRYKYAALKRDLAAAHPEDRDSYTAGKSDFVERVVGNSVDESE